MGNPAEENDRMPDNIHPIQVARFFASPFLSIFLRKRTTWKARRRTASSNLCATDTWQDVKVATARNAFVTIRERNRNSLFLYPRCPRPVAMLSER